MAVDPLRIFGLLGGEDLEPDDAPPELGRAQTASPTPPPGKGTLFAGRYRIQGNLGQGAFGDVLLAQDETLTREVAIKLLRQGSPQLRARFKREAQATASLSHPNILAVFQIGEHEDRPFIVYELVHGARDLTTAFEGRDLEARLDLFEQALAGVAAAHAEGIVHRDLKPENILVQPPGRVYVADFGLAHVSESSLTATGQFLGTPAYMAPEQVLGKETSPATDVWALGQIFYEALYQQTWIQDTLTIQELISRICAARFEPPPGAPRKLRKLLFEEVLVRRTSERIPNASVFLSKLRAIRNPPPKPAFAPWLFSILVLFAGALAGSVAMGAIKSSMDPSATATAPSPSPSLPVEPAPSPPPSRPLELAPSPSPSPPVQPAPSPSPSLSPPAEPSPSPTPRPEPAPSRPARVEPSPSPSPEPTPSSSPAPAEPSPAPSQPAASATSASSYGTAAYYALRRRLIPASAEEVRAAAEAGELAAMRQWGRRLYLGWTVAPDQAAGREWLKRAAVLGCPDSMEDLSRSYMNLPDPKSKRLSAMWEKRAIEAGAQGALLRRHASKRGPFLARAARNAVAAGDDETALRTAQFFFDLGAKERSLDWAMSAIALGNQAARGVRARIWLQSGPRSYDDAIPDLKAATATGGSVGALELARCTMLGRGVPRDLGRAAHLLSLAKSAGARPSDMAYFEILLEVQRTREANSKNPIVLDKRVDLCLKQGSHYSRGELGLLLLDFSREPKTHPRIRAQAAALLRAAENTINPQVHVYLGLALLREDFASKASKSEAAASFRRAALLDDPLGYLNYGTALLRSMGVPQDIPTGVSYLEKAGAAGVTRAWTNLANFFVNRGRYPGHYNFQRALDYFEKARQSGAKHAIRKAALRLESEEQLHAEARRLFAIEAKRGDPISSFHLARYLLSTRGGVPDEVQAVRVLLAVRANARTPEICDLLGDCYAQGRGVSVDAAAAAAWRDQAKSLRSLKTRRE